MYGNRFLRLSLVLAAALSLFALPVRAIVDDPNDPDQPSLTEICNLHLVIQEQGTATVVLRILARKPLALPLEQVEEALRDVFGDSLAVKHRNKSGNLIFVSGVVEKAFRPRDGRIEGHLDLEPLAEVLRPLGVPNIKVSISSIRMDPDSPASAPLPQDYTVSTAAPQVIHFVLEFPTGPLVRVALILAGLLLAPLALLMWQRWLALRTVEKEPAVAWYRFWRWLHWTTLGTWLVWLTAVPALEVDLLLPSLLLESPRESAPVRWTVTLLPPWVVTLFGSALAQEVFQRLTKQESNAGMILRRVFTSVLTTLLPLLLALFGLFTMAEAGFRAGFVWLAVALAVRVVALRLVAAGPDLQPHALTVGPLRDRIFELARQAGVPLTQVYVLPTGKMPEANALAMQGNQILLTDHLVRQLTRREVDAIVAHELAHLRYRHPTWLILLLVVVIFAPTFVQPLFPLWAQASWLRHVPVGLVLAIVGYYFVSRRFEYQTDAYAAWLTGDPEALITGLVKVHRLNLLPMRWGKWEEGLLTHPSTSLRLESIARQNGISRQRLQDILDEPELLGESYALPELAAVPDRVFTTPLKGRFVSRITQMFLAAMVLTPALVACAVWWSGLTGPARWVALAGGALLTFGILLVLQNYLPLWGYAEIRQRLSAKLNAEGLDPEAGGGIFVSFAPDSSPRIYEGYTNWDVGFLFLQGDRLCYVGDQIRFALTRDQVTEVRLGPGMPRWWAVPYLYVGWQDPERGTAGTFNVRAGQVRSMRQLGSETGALCHRLQAWREQAPAPADLPAPLAELTTPTLGEVTSLPVQALLTPSGLLTHVVLVFGLAGGLSLLLGLPFDPAEGGIGWSVPVIAVLGFGFEILPLWRKGFAERTG